MGCKNSIEMNMIAEGQVTFPYLPLTSDAHQCYRQTDVLMMATMMLQLDTLTNGGNNLTDGQTD